MRNEKGFTLIELVVVIVILGILAATALPKFVDLKSDAAQASVSGAAGSLTSASTINYATSSVRGATHATVERLNGANACATLIASTKAMATWDARFTVSVDASCAGPAVAGDVKQCTIATSDAAGVTAIAKVICTG